jgi:glutathione peroxidase
MYYFTRNLLCFGALVLCLACGADGDEQSSGFEGAFVQPVDASVESSPPDLSAEASPGQADAGLETDVEMMLMIPQPEVDDVCESFTADHFYRQSAERFADYEIREMCDFRGELLLIVNTAAKCGLTPQYEGLTALDEQYGAAGLRILGFLSNDFGNQAGSQSEVESCNDDYRIDFEQFTPVGVLSGSGQHPIFRWLTTQNGQAGEVEWNFGKFLVNGEGELIARWSSYLEPENQSIISTIEAALDVQAGME